MRARRGGVLICVLAVVLTSLGGLAQPRSVDAAGESGASSRVVGRGDIVTSIIGWRTSSLRRTGAAARHRCRWVTLHDAQLEWLASVSAASVDLGGPNPVLDALRGHLGDGDLPDGDVAVRYCGTEVTDVRFTARSAPRGTTELLHRRMITRLPVPEPRWSPPPHVDVPLHQPLFVSIPAGGWRRVHSSITVDGTTAEVRAEPVALRVVSGEPGATALHCDGPGRPFDPRDSASVSAQATRRGACTFSYRSPSPRDAAGRPAPWIGTVTVLWRAEWRTDGGEWLPLGTIPRTRLFDRSAREVPIAIEHWPR
jgi:hypothetical protein